MHMSVYHGVCVCIVNDRSELEFYMSPGAEQISDDDIELRLRCQRLVAAGVWVAKQFPR